MTSDCAERVGIALSLIPDRIRGRIGPVDIREDHPAHVGVAWGGVVHDEHLDLFTAGTHAFFSDPAIHQAHLARTRRRPVVWLPRTDLWTPTIATILHELGHALWFAIFEPHRHERVYWDPGQRTVRVAHVTGLMPSMLALTNYERMCMLEQFAEAFALWLLPVGRDRKAGGDATGLYHRSRDLTVGEDGWRFDNRHLLGLFNELAGWPVDTPPRALR